MATQHEVWKDASELRSIALDKAIEMTADRGYPAKDVLEIAKQFAAFLLGNCKE